MASTPGSYLLQPVPPEDRLLCRGINPNTGLVDPTESSQRSGWAPESRPKIDPGAEAGSWQKDGNGWNYSSIVEHPLTRYQRELTTDLLDPSTPPSPPEATTPGTRSLGRPLIKRKPVAANEMRKDYHTANTSFRRSSTSAGTRWIDPNIERGCNSSCNPDSALRNSDTGSRSDRLTGWVIQSKSFISEPITMPEQAECTQYDNRRARPSLRTTEADSHPQRVSPRRHNSRMPIDIYSKNRFQLPRVQTLRQRKKAAKQYGQLGPANNLHTNADFAQSAQGYLTTILELWSVSRIDELSSVCLYGLMIMLQHIVRTFARRDPNVQQQQSLLERNTPHDLGLAVLYIVLLILVLRGALMIAVLVYQLVQSLLQVVLWFTDLCWC